MMNVTTAFLRGEIAAANQSRKKAQPIWRQHKTSHKPNFDKRLDFKSQHKVDKRQDRFTPLTKTPKEILAMETVKFKTSPPMTRPAKNQNKNKFCEFCGDKGHNTDECIHLRRQIEDVGKTSHQRESYDDFHGPTLEMNNKIKDQPKLLRRWRVSLKSAIQALLQQAPLEIKSRMIPATTPLLGFNSEISRPLGQISLRSSLGDEEHFTSALMNFMVNAKIPSGWRNSDTSQQHHNTGGVQNGSRSTKQIPTKEPRFMKGIKVSIHPEYLEQTVTIGGSLSEKGRIELCNMLKDNLDIFAWKLADMTGIPRSIAKHRLNINEGCQSIRQKRRGQAPDRNNAIQEEVAKLVEAEIMREVHYHDWLSNPVMVKKHDGNWRMCVDFMDLNKSCLKDCYPLPEIDWKVESLCGYPFKCFLDAYKGYHQIQMVEEDEEKTAFHTSQGIFCYTKMSFGLKIAGTTYQRLVDKSFERDIEETFHNLRRINMKLNPKKCTFGAEEGAFLGHVVSMKGIKACLEKAEAVMKLQSP
ncbi:reverse transcriptase domain-containing protein [Tanacetum coccineum]